MLEVIPNKILLGRGLVTKVGVPCCGKPYSNHGRI